jgi:hypothetical protein
MSHKFLSLVANISKLSLRTWAGYLSETATTKFTTTVGP